MIARTPRQQQIQQQLLTQRITQAVSTSRVRAASDASVATDVQLQQANIIDQIGEIGLRLDNAAIP